MLLLLLHTTSWSWVSERVYENPHLQLLDSVLFMRAGDLYNAYLVRTNSTCQISFSLPLSFFIKGFIHPSIGGVGLESVFIFCSDLLIYTRVKRNKFKLTTASLLDLALSCLPHLLKHFG